MENPARTFALALGGARLVGGIVQVVAPGRFLAALGRPATRDQAGALVGFRMKGARDVALGLLTLGVGGRGERLAAVTSAAVVIDTIDGFAVAADRGRSLRPLVTWAGAPLGFAVGAAAAWAWGTLGRQR